MKRLLENFVMSMREGRDTQNVVKVVLIDGDGKVLILKRSGKVVSKASPWEWDLPGGHVEYKERKINALEREVFEETRMRFEGARRIYAQDGTTFFVCEQFAGSPKLSDEHEEFIWVKPEDVSNYNIGSKYETAIKRALTK
jgi:8-oxo-dGTP diphosphatase